ncbi:DNA polymerase II large subunit [Candidatus Woesearchaeota archaeon]|nr:DNA polymerase II large subunit [Candidatus Woesearchaeota archaeon]
MSQASDIMKKYFNHLNTEVRNAFDIASKARSKNYDPENSVEVFLAKNMAERVIGIISIVAPQLVGSGANERILELEKEYNILDWRVALTIAGEIAQQKFCKFEDKLKAMEVGIRVGLAYLTLGTVTAPLEGFTQLKIKKRIDNGKEYFALYYSGPIRAAGGTAAAVSVLIADYVRVVMGYEAYDPTEKEVLRSAREVEDYHERVTNLQYHPSEDEIKFLAQHLPVQIHGDPSEKIEVSNYKDLKRIETNLIRGGFCLVMAEALAQKAKKVGAQLDKWGNDMNLAHWAWLNDFLTLQKKIKAKGQTGGSSKDEKPKITPDYTFISDLVAGRPVLTYPLRSGGFRLRYGRARTSGYSGQCVHPATMHVLNDFIAVGTQLKVERPGKGAAFTPCDLIEGPIVKLKDGSVLMLENEALAKQYKSQIQEVLFLGDALINYGDFLNRAHILVPPGYCEEWWIQEVEKATVNLFGTIDYDKLSEFTEIESDIIENIFTDFFKTKPNPTHAFILSKKLNVPLHPFYTYHWKDISADDFVYFINWLKNADVKKEGYEINKVILRQDSKGKRILELLGVPHAFVNNEYVVLDKIHGSGLFYNLGGFRFTDDYIKSIDKDASVLGLINKISEVKIKDKSGVYIGARMGRPEKAKMRKLTGSPQVLFPVGNEGGRLRCFQSALEKGKIRSDFPLYSCDKCKKNFIYQVCPECGNPTRQLYYCRVCGDMFDEECKQHGMNLVYKKQDIDIKYYFNKSLEILGMKVFPDLIKGVRGTSGKDHIPENLVKGILRAKHNLFVNKDGTLRYDASEIGITHFKPKEIRTSIEKLRELGYDLDIDGRPLENENQILEIKPQDIILPCCPVSPEEPADVVFFRATKFLDELMVSLYGLNPFYNLSSKDDLVGHLAIGLAPHTSAGTLVRIIGFSQTQGFLAHPMVHAAMRRDCDGDESCILLLMDAFLNFSKKYLSTSRGSTMDAPLVLTSVLDPSGIDDMAFDIDIVWKYPLEFYEACSDYKMPWDIKVKIIKHVLGTPEQYEGMGFTHDTDNINAGVLCSSYKTLPSMEDKLKHQMDVAVKLRAVDESDVARLVIEKHFIRDTKGNLRKFSQQSFRCVNCNEIYRRPPLSGKCTCGGRIIFTISEGSIVKYLEPSLSLAKKYNVPAFLQQSLELTKRRIEGVFGKEHEIQEGLGKWFG